MRIAKRVGNRYKFGVESIKNIPYVDIFIEPENNKIVTDGCKEVLYKSMTDKTFPYGEQGLLVSTMEYSPSIHINFRGNYKRIRTSELYHTVVDNRPNTDLIFIHNHPNNTPFSANDLLNLSGTPSILAIIAVGNTHNVHIAIDTDIHDKISNHISNYKQKYKQLHHIPDKDESLDSIIADKSVKYILDNPNKFGLEYIKMRRGSINEKQIQDR